MKCLAREVGGTSDTENVARPSLGPGRVHDRQINGLEQEEAVARTHPNLSTGLPGLDLILTGLIPGDNLVWQVDSALDYESFVKPYVEMALRKDERLTYFRFGKCPPLLPDGVAAEIHELHPEAGFESFVSDVYRTVERAGRGGYYVFDCLSDLAVDWYSDQMLGNFFMLTCPHFFDVKAIAYFSLMRGHHSAEAVDPVLDTAQVVVDVFRHNNELYVHPLKVQHRHSQTMYSLHVQQGDDFRTVTESATISEIMNSARLSGRKETRQTLGVVNRVFLEAEKALDASEHREPSTEQYRDIMVQLLQTAVTRDARILRLAEEYLTLSDVVDIKNRMVGTGLIGGKAIGMILARAILKQKDSRWESLLEPHDSFFVGSDVYYTFVVRNGLWWIRERQKKTATFLDGAEYARQRMLVGTFPEHVMKQLSAIVDHFGQSPIIVRSSSLLEDSFGNSFNGKYESVLCPNQGPREQRLEDFLAAVRTVYASTMSETALIYRQQRGLLECDEQMGLLIQRMSGGVYGDFFFPQIAGVGLSYNPYVWSRQIDPEAGALRIVLGLGTRAVDRSDDDYTRIVALNAPERRPESGIDKIRPYAQRKIDVIDIQKNRLVSTEFSSVASGKPDFPLELFASHDPEMVAAGRKSRIPAFPWVLTFDKMLRDTDFATDMRQMLSTLQQVFNNLVDVEFAASFSSDGSYRINLVQCRPLQAKDEGVVIDAPEVCEEDVVFRAQGAVMGQARAESIDRVIYVVPRAYNELPLQQRYAVARLIGKIIGTESQEEPKRVALLGPGRWGTTTPSLGVPASFSEVSKASVLCEIVSMGDGLVPDVSLGTHFFNELVEMNVLYVALFPEQDGNMINDAFFESSPNRLAEIFPGDKALAGTVRVIDVAEIPGHAVLMLNANTLTQKVVCYVKRSDGK